MKRIVVIGGGFAGLWAAAGAMRRLDELQSLPTEPVGVSLINPDPWHVIRVRTYEQDLSDARVRLADVLDPIGVELVIGAVRAIDAAGHTVELESGQTIRFDRLVLAAGSGLKWPDLPGLPQHAFHVDTFAGGAALNAHIAALGDRPDSAGRNTVVVAGGGLTGVEVACEMPEKLRAAGISAGRVVIVDTLPHIGSDMGSEARPVIEQALETLGVQIRVATEIAEVDAQGITLRDGERIPTQTLIWTAGMRASPLAAMIPGKRDALGRLQVDSLLRVTGVVDVFAAGDVAALNLDGTHTSVMSCQHGRPMGRFAGHNVVADLLGLEMLPLRIDQYVTCLDLGAWGALYTEGWDRRLALAGPDAKRTKQIINRERIYPPRSRNRREILDAAAPIIQPLPLRLKR